jgi:hypothetical protein
MKKSIILFGAFALLLVAPSFAQEKSEEITKTTEKKPLKYEKVSKERSSNKQLQVAPKEEVSEEKVERKVIKQKEIKKVENVESEKLKTTQPIRKEEK